MIGTNHKARVTELINYYGEPITLSYTTTGVFDPTTGSYTTGSTTSITTKGYLSSYTRDEVDGSVIMAGDLKVYISELSTIPQSGWVCTTYDKTYRVLDVKPRRKGSETVHYVCQLRI